MPVKVHLDPKAQAFASPYEAYSLFERVVPAPLENGQVHIWLDNVLTYRNRHQLGLGGSVLDGLDELSTFTVSEYVDSDNTRYYISEKGYIDADSLELVFKFDFAGMPMDRYSRVSMMHGSAAHNRLRKLIRTSIVPLSLYGTQQLENIAKDLLKLAFHIPELDLNKHDKIILHAPTGDEVYDFSALFNTFSFYFPKPYIRKILNGIRRRDQEANEHARANFDDSDFYNSSFDALTDGQYGDGRRGSDLDSTRDAMGL